jgi:hypothetical protein
MGLSSEFHLLHRKIHASCGDLMQQRLPEMGPRLVNERNIGDAPPTQRVAKACDELKAAGTAADNDDVMHLFCLQTANLSVRSAWGGTQYQGDLHGFAIARCVEINQRAGCHHGNGLRKIARTRQG